MAERGILKTVIGMFQTMFFVDQTTLPSMWYMPMILCIYLTIPFAVIVKDKISSAAKYMLIPAAAVFVYAMCLPSFNMLIVSIGKSSMSTPISQGNLFSVYYIYILIGWFVSKGGFERIKDWIILSAAVLSFILCVGFQIYIFKCPADLYIYYDFFLLPVCAAAIFEYIRRKAYLLKKISKPITSLSRSAFAIYFVHIVIMSAMYWFIYFGELNQFVKMAILESVSFAGSIIIIYPLSKIPLLKRYLFMIK
jgi:surface polysaccharide O-acyltransferase-like enzyme